MEESRGAWRSKERSSWTATSSQTGVRDLHVLGNETETGLGQTRRGVVMSWPSQASLQGSGDGNAGDGDGGGGSYDLLLQIGLCLRSSYLASMY